MKSDSEMTKRVNNNGRRQNGGGVQVTASPSQKCNVIQTNDET